MDWTCQVTSYKDCYSTGGGMVPGLQAWATKENVLRENMSLMVNGFEVWCRFVLSFNINFYTIQRQECYFQTLQENLTWRGCWVFAVVTWLGVLAAIKRNCSHTPEAFDSCWCIRSHELFRFWYSVKACVRCHKDSCGDVWKWKNHLSQWSGLMLPAGLSSLI